MELLKQNALQIATGANPNDIELGFLSLVHACKLSAAEAAKLIAGAVVGEAANGLKEGQQLNRVKFVLRLTNGVTYYITKSTAGFSGFCAQLNRARGSCSWAVKKWNNRGDLEKLKNSVFASIIIEDLQQYLLELHQHPIELE